MATERFFEVYLANATRSFDGAYSYSDGGRGGVEAGMLVELPFGRGASVRRAWVWRELATPPEFPCKSILRSLSRPLLRADQFELAREMRRRYFCSMSQALSVMAPPTVVSVGEKRERLLRLGDEEEAAEMLEAGELRSLGQIRVLEFLLDSGEATALELMNSCQVGRSVLSGLRKKGILHSFSREIARESTGLKPSDEAAVTRLNAYQEAALAGIREAVPAKNASRLTEILLHGVTGSGKTEVYLRAAEEILSQGGDVVILVPEIALTPLICGRIAARFGDAAAVLHSRLTPAERYEQWRQIRSGEKRLVAGARSAIFAPLEKIGLIIIDEEQESSYKSERAPRYHAAEIARIRAVQHGAKLLFSSATPSLTQFHRCEEGRCQLLSLPERAGEAVLPELHMVKMRRELASGHTPIVSRALSDALRDCFADGHQAMIFLNRRGHNHFRLCQDCGYLLRCESCDVAMTEHLNPWAKAGSTSSSQMICHYCGKLKRVSDDCPNCGGPRFTAYGVGTQQAERWFNEHFPDRRVLRMDLDSTVGRDAHARILERFAAGEADCLIGTQMIAKGHDFPSVTLVGILSADQLLALDDYMAEERAFQLICQAAGRAGRRDVAGAVYVQAFDEENLAIRAAAKQDYHLFYQQELFKRKSLSYPPFSDIGVMLLSSYSEKEAEQAADELYRDLASRIAFEKIRPADIRLYRPQAAPLARLRRLWRFRVIAKSPRRDYLCQLLSAASDRAYPAGVRFSADINPANML